jgi:hypothetical protein
MKKTAVILALTIFSLAIFLPFTLNTQAANAQATSYSIQQVDQTVQVLYSGQVVISDKITLSGTLPSNFQIGLPFKYGSYLLKGIAYDSNYQVLPVALGVQLQDQSGFYGISVNLPSGTSNSFTVDLILSNGVLTPTSTGYNLDFPGYPGLTQVASDCNVTITLPSGATMVGISKSDGIVNATNYDTPNLAPFTYSPAIATFSADSGTIQQVTIPNLTRQVGISPSGTITCTDTYKIVNNSTNAISSFLINMPLTASNIVARDQFGRVLTVTVQQQNSQVLVENVTLAAAANEGETSLLTLDYSLPGISPAQFAKYVLTFDLFPYFNYYIDSASVTISPPEGATIVTPQLSVLSPGESLTRNAFSESLTITKTGVSFIDSVIPSEELASVTFNYNPLWIAFRPTSWMFAIVFVGLVIVGIWKLPRTKTSTPRTKAAKMIPGQALNSQSINDFVDAYEEKNKITREISSLEAKAEHGRIPRRRYKVQRKSLELRLDALNQTIAQLKETMRSAGGSYADSIRQIETAEVELNEVEMSIRNAGVRHETGELSMEAYRKQLSDLEKRQKKVETTLNSLLLRLRGEMS